MRNSYFYRQYPSGRKWGRFPPYGQSMTLLVALLKFLWNCLLKLNQPSDHLWVRHSSFSQWGRINIVYFRTQREVLNGLNICILCLIIILCTHVRSRHMFRFFSKLPHMYLPLCIVKLIFDFHKKKEGRENIPSHLHTYAVVPSPLQTAEWSKMVKWWGGSLDALEYGNIGNQNSPRCQELWSGCRLTVGLLWVLWKFEISETTVHKGKNWKQ